MVTAAILVLALAPAIADESLECREQRAQPFLIRANLKEDPRGFRVAVREAIRWRVTTYGEAAILCLGDGRLIPGG